MANKASTQQKAIKMDIEETIPHSEFLRTLNHLRILQMTLSRFASLLDGNSVEVMAVTQSALKKLGNEIIQVLASRHMRNNRDAVQNWENEGGKVAYVTV